MELSAARRERRRHSINVALESFGPALRSMNGTDPGLRECRQCIQTVLGQNAALQQLVDGATVRRSRSHQTQKPLPKLPQGALACQVARAIGIGVRGDEDLRERLRGLPGRLAAR